MEGSIFVSGGGNGRRDGGSGVEAGDGRGADVAVQLRGELLAAGELPTHCLRAPPRAGRGRPP